MEVLITLPFWLLVVSTAGIFAIFTLGLQIQAGTSGLPNFGHVASLAIGGYVLALTTTELGWPWFASVPAAVAGSVGAALMVSWPTLRLRGAYFAIAWIAFGEIVRFVLLNEQELTGGARGVIGYNAPWREYERFVLRTAESLGWVEPDPQVPLAIAAWAVAIVLATFVAILTRSPWGRVMRAIREDEDAVRALGKPVLRHRLEAMALGAAIAGLAGVLYAYNLASVNPNTYQPAITFLAYAMLVVGGAGSPFGVLFGALIISVIYAGVLFLDLPFSAQQLSALRIMVIGLVVMLVVTFRPQGISGNRQEQLFERE